MNQLRRLVTAVAVAASMVLALAATASAASVPDQRLHPPSVSAQVSCGYYSGKTETVRGDKGDRVREVQCLLLYWGYSVGPSGVDGDFGANTEAGVKAFQADTYGVCGPPGLVDDGRVGKHTWSALRSSNSCPTE
ncbi:peptidoglycan-binding domain-containing protein [Actinophytocola oryzae]|uniref:Putative peptidoglycan binding protein n=1 Tax=Actinophytocola oryzae TaxID=502181 RepID=A0A4R7VYE3_9PSEU|nr:peptidoglycan-binding domain-containing protein [Actinophytocola oryzae]TDV55042.1 putative peptidoglycan binding protein [Actinophytocola oryzae]